MIAQGISPLDVESAARAAGRIMLTEMEARLENNDDFALETTLASRTLAPFVKRCKEAGYRFTLIYVWLQQPELAVARVAKRVRSGGHNIPEDVIRRRYERGLTNFLSLYKELADEWIVVDNTGEETINVAHFQNGEIEILQPQTWAVISEKELP